MHPQCLAPLPLPESSQLCSLQPLVVPHSMVGCRCPSAVSLAWKTRQPGAPAWQMVSMHERNSLSNYPGRPHFASSHLQPSSCWSPLPSLAESQQARPGHWSLGSCHHSSWRDLKPPPVLEKMMKTQHCQESEILHNPRHQILPMEWQEPMGEACVPLPSTVRPQTCHEAHHAS